MIDYIVTNEGARDEVRKEGCRTELDHILINVELESVIENKGENRKKWKIEKSDWTEEGIKYYYEKCEECSQTEIKDIW